MKIVFANAVVGFSDGKFVDDGSLESRRFAGYLNATAIDREGSPEEVLVRAALHTGAKVVDDNGEEIPIARPNRGSDEPTE